MKRRNLAALAVATAMVSSLAGYGKTGDTFEVQAGVEQEAVAEVRHGETGDAGCGIPDESTGAPEAAAEAAHVPVDITGCDTFAQIVDRLQSGQGYAYASINGEDVLLITDHTFGITDRIASIDADIYHHADGLPACMGHVSAGGTAYPLAIADGKLYACGNHCVHKYTAGNGSLVLDQVAYVRYDCRVEDDPAYFVRSEARDIATGPDGQVEDDSWLSALHDEYTQGETIEFTVIP